MPTEGEGEGITEVGRGEGASTTHEHTFNHPLGFSKTECSLRNNTQAGNYFHQPRDESSVSPYSDKKQPIEAETTDWVSP